MMIRILLLFLTLTFAGELEVEGDLKVTGDIDSPTIDALSGMKPDRIYKYIGVQWETKGLTVPNNKCWMISSTIPGDPSGDIAILNSNDTYIAQLYSGGVVSPPIIMLSGDIFNIYFARSSLINIYEYSISGSGTDQGMDYIEP